MTAADSVDAALTALTTTLADGLRVIAGDFACAAGIAGLGAAVATPEDGVGCHGWGIWEFASRADTLFEGDRDL